MRVREKTLTVYISVHLCVSGCVCVYGCVFNVVGGRVERQQLNQRVKIVLFITALSGLAFLQDVCLKGEMQLDRS